MQILESSSFGVRSAIWTLASPDAARTVMLCPMVHVAERGFYDAVAERLDGCDTILLEGVGGRTAARLSRGYGQLARAPRLGLVSQREMPLEAVRDRIIRLEADADFDAQWRGLPWAIRSFLPIVSHGYFTYLRHFGTRAMLARHLEVELLAARGDILDETFKDVDTVILDRRDAHLCAALDEHLAQPAGPRGCIGVVYGAAHIPAVIRHLIKGHGYTPAQGDWLTVFSL
ncbi:hypothetical protein C8N43_3091 [Litoreibacter ponti]|uniref:TraB family protein n=1 Tax=Litoreibacter ponti TaxID=1510457 RepID=A0A2T6BDY3_9RHOB|nr:hypothetical protein [Litoreibacter ponti]PTX54278.1 hypothetical protein C8N43_3091 [Litoreibacter ponti]